MNDFLAIPYSRRAQVYSYRVFHKWTSNKKWKERERAGWMTVIEHTADFDKSLRLGYSEHPKHGAN
jgi:hypothetical protein